MNILQLISIILLSLSIGVIVSVAYLTVVYKSLENIIISFILFFLTFVFVFNNFVYFAKIILDIALKGI